MPSIDASAFVPAALRRHLSDGGQPPEHRHVAVAFIAFGGIDRAPRRAKAGRPSPPGSSSLVTTAQSVFDELGVTFLATDIYGDGGKIIAVAGAPTGWPNNEERLLRATRAIADIDFGLPLHIGLNRGSVFVGDIGPVFRRTYTLLGDAVNTAARVMASAGANQIRTMPAVLDRSDSLFAVERQAPFAAKGKSEPLVTFAVGEPAGHREDIQGRLPLVGRDRGTGGALRDAFEEAGRGEVHVVEVTGDGGIGKTRLVQEFTEAIDDVPHCCGPRASSTSPPRRTSSPASCSMPCWVSTGSPDGRRTRCSAHVRQQVEAAAPQLASLAATHHGADAASRFRPRLRSRPSTNATSRPVCATR